MSSIDKTLEESEDGVPIKYHFFEDSLINLQSCKEELRQAFEKNEESNKDFESEEENKNLLKEEKQVELNYEKILMEINIQKELKLIMRKKYIEGVTFDDFFGIFENWFESEIFPSQKESQVSNNKETNNQNAESDNEEEVQLDTIKNSKNNSEFTGNEQLNLKADDNLTVLNTENDIGIGLFKNKSFQSERNELGSDAKVFSEGASIKNSFKTQDDLSRSASTNRATGDKFEGINNVIRESIANLWDLIVEENRFLIQELYDSFCVPIMHESHPEGLKDRRLGFQNVYLFFREIFYSDNGLSLFMDRYEEIDFFSQENSFKGFLKETAKIVRELKGSELSEETIKDQVFSLEETLNIIKVWLSKQRSARIIRDQTLIKANKDKGQNENNDIKSILLQTIEKYKLMLDKSKDEKSTQQIKATLETLKKQLESVGKKTRKPNEKITSAPGVITEARDKRERALMEIFGFYCKEKALSRVHTFEQVNYEKNVMNISKFFIFVKEFKMSSKYLNAQKLVELYRKSVDHQHPELTYSQFKAILFKLTPYVLGYEQPETKSEEEIKEDLYRYMELEDSSKYRAKMQVFIPSQQTPLDKDKKKVVPFNLTKSPGRSPDNQKDDAQTKKAKQEVPKPANQKKPSQEGKESYQKKQEKYLMDKKLNNEKVNWDKLGDLAYTDIKNLDDEEFEPAKFFELQNENEDSLYLAEYDLETDKMKKDKQLEEGRKVLSDYGKAKPQPRVIPAQKFSKMEKSEGSSPNSNVNPNRSPNTKLIPMVKSKEDEGRIRFETSPNERKIAKAVSSNFRTETSPFERDDYLKKQKVENMKSNMIARANELDKASKIKEERQIKTLIENQENNIKKGLKIAHNKK